MRRDHLGCRFRPKQKESLDRPHIFQWKYSSCELDPKERSRVIVFQINLRPLN